MQKKNMHGAPDVAIMEAENFSRCFASSGLWSFDTSDDALKCADWSLQIQ